MSVHVAPESVFTFARKTQHRREPQSGRLWRTRRDPFADVWPVLLGWLEERPDMEAKEMLKRLQPSGYGSYTDGQLRTLQRRVREWRRRIAHDLVYGTDVAQVGTAEAIEADRPVNEK